MLKLFWKAIACAAIATFLGASMSESGKASADGIMVFSWGFAFLVCFVIPFIYGKIASAIRNARWELDSRRARNDRVNAEEQAHQTALRRERERMEMHAEVRVKELIAIAEVQYRADAQKMKLLAEIKADFANRQQADLTGLLGRLEAMKAGVS